MTYIERLAGRNRWNVCYAIISGVTWLWLGMTAAGAVQLQQAQTVKPGAGNGSPAVGEKSKPKETTPKSPSAELEGRMTLTRIEEIVRRLDENAKEPRPGSWQLTISDRLVIVVTDQINNRMRIISPISKTDGMPEALLKRLMQANFDTALDARYAIAKGLLWATYIHPLRALHDRQFISAIGQTVNLALTFGSTFSSGAMTFGGGDSRGLIQKQLIEKLMKKGLPI